MISEDIFGRTALLAGPEAMERLARARVIVFGVGGVGSWAVECLARTGVGHITIVDSDEVAPTNINRQLPATTATVGRPKVEVLRERMLEINPAIDVVAVNDVYTPENSASYNLEDYDYVVDAIDSLRCKAALILHATSARRPRLFASMGAALKVDAGRISVAEFWKVEGCPLARALRQRFKRTGQFPRRKFKCVYSPEVVPNRVHTEVPAATAPGDRWSSSKAVINGTFCHTTAIFGLRLAGEIIRDITGL